MHHTRAFLKKQKERQKAQEETKAKELAERETDAWKSWLDKINDPEFQRKNREMLGDGQYSTFLKNREEKKEQAAEEKWQKWQEVKSRRNGREVALQYWNTWAADFMEFTGAKEPTCGQLFRNHR